MLLVLPFPFLLFHHASFPFNTPSSLEPQSSGEWGTLQQTRTATAFVTEMGLAIQVSSVGTIGTFSIMALLATIVSVSNFAFFLYGCGPSTESSMAAALLLVIPPFFFSLSPPSFFLFPPQATVFFKIARATVDFLALKVLKQRYLNRTAKYEWTVDYSDEKGQGDLVDFLAEDYISGNTLRLHASSVCVWV